MTAATVKRRAALVRFHVRRALGAAGASGLALAAVAAAVLGAAAHVQQDALRTRERADALRDRRPVPSVAVPVFDPAREPAAFRDGLPPSTQTQEDLRRVFRIAGEQRIALARGDYATTVRRDARMTAYDVVLPVRAAYPAVRILVARVLNELPHAGLTELRIERGAGTAGTVDARLRFTLHYREER